MLPQLEQYQQQPQQRQQQQQQESPQRVLYTTRRPDERSEPPQDYTVVMVDDKQLGSFVRSVYLYAIVLILISSIAWLIITGTKFDFPKATPIPFYVWLILNFAVVMILSVVRKARFCFPLNWVMLICLMATTIICGTFLMEMCSISDVLVVLSGLAISFVITAMIYAIGAMGPQKLVLGLNLYLVLFCAVFIPLAILLIVFLILRNYVVGLVLGIFILCFFTLQMLFQAQSIHGRQEYVPLNDVLLSAILIFGDFNGLPIALGLFYVFHIKNT